MSSPTLIPFANFDPESDARGLKASFKNFHSDEHAMMEILAYRTLAQRFEIAIKFKEIFGEDLIEGLENNLRGDFEHLIMALTLDPIVFQAKQLHAALGDRGWDDGSILEILTIHSNEEVVKIVQTYESMYNKCLKEVLENDILIDGDRLLIALSNATRDESETIDEEKALQDAQTLIKAEGQLAGTEEGVLIEFLCQRNCFQVCRTLDEFEEIAGHPLEKSIEDEFSGTTMDLLLDLIECIRDREEYMATRLYDSILGNESKNRVLIRLVVGRSEIDLGAIKTAFEEKYEKSLEDYMDKHYFGDSRQCLLKIIKV